MKITIEIDTNEFGDIALCEAICRELLESHARVSKVVLDRVLSNMPIRAENLIKQLEGQGFKINSVEDFSAALMNGQLKGIGGKTIADIHASIARAHKELEAISGAQKQSDKPTI